MNHISLIGRIGKELAIEKFGDKAYAKFSLAVSDGKDAQGNDITDWFECIAWEKKAETLVKYCGKGHMLAVQGKMKTKKVEKDGKTITYYSVNVSDFTFIQPKEDKPQFDTGKKQVVQPDDLPF